MAYNIHWYFHVNLRALQWLCELRSSPAGHPGYRHVAQEMAKQVSRHMPSVREISLNLSTMTDMYLEDSDKKSALTRKKCNSSAEKL